MKRRRLIGLMITLFLTLDAVSVNATGLCTGRATKEISAAITNKAAAARDTAKAGENTKETMGGYRAEEGIPAAPLSEEAKIRLCNTANLPSSYSSVEEGYITPVKDQGKYGVCWAFAALAACEADAVKNEGYSAQGEDAIDLSERHLSYFAYHVDGDYDPLGGMAGDKITYTGDKPWYDQAGNSEMVQFTLASWIGAAQEKDFPYENMSEIGWEGEFRSDLTLRNCFSYDIYADADMVKNAIMTYGAVTTAYFSDKGSDHYFNEDKTCYYQNINAPGLADHSVAVVGWDDNYPKENFGNDNQEGGKIRPAKNGAWLIKNSWGAAANDKGYFWLSYEDTSLNSAFVFDVQRGDTYDHNYQYDVGSSCSAFAWLPKAANVYTAQADEILDAVGIMIEASETASYKISIYKNPKEGNPSSGTLASETLGYFDASGFYTIDLDRSVALSKGDRFSVCVDLEAGETDFKEHTTYCPATFVGDLNKEIPGLQTTTAHAERGQSYFYERGPWRDPKSNKNEYIWKDFQDTEDPSMSNLRIKAFTKLADAGITVDKKEVALGIGGTQQLHAAAWPSGSANREVSWRSSDENVVKVDKNGLLTGVSEGTAVVTATMTADGSNYASSCKVSVGKLPIRISLDKKELLLEYAQSEKLTATVYPKDAIDTDVIWTSSNGDIASVSKDGVITRCGYGDAVITATNQRTGVSASCVVSTYYPVESVTITWDEKYKDVSSVGDQFTLRPNLNPDHATNKGVHWRSDHPSVATVDANGVVTAISPGKATITVTTDDGGHTDSLVVTVEASVGDKVADKTTGATIKITGSTEAEYIAPAGSSKTVKIPEKVTIGGKKYKVTSIAAKAFKGNKKVTTVKLGKNVKTIGTEAFSGCKNLKTVTVGSNVTAVGAKAFYNCTKLKKISLPAKVTIIGKQAFNSCKNLKKITIKSTKLKTVGKNALKGVKKNAVIDVPNSKVKAYKELFDKDAGYRKTMKIK